jgi:8-oxo-dGTP pyrophosphatase MutT (NUDIX family)
MVFHPGFGRVRNALCMAHRAEYYHDPLAPRANSLTPTAFAAVRDESGRLLMCRRADTLNWELPGGKVDFGESADQAAVREVTEETGVVVRVTGLLGLYTDPGHVMVYPTGEVRQQFAVCFHAVPLAGDPRPDGDETVDAAWISAGEVPRLPVHPSVRLRVDHALAASDQVHFG